MKQDRSLISSSIDKIIFHSQALGKAFLVTINGWSYFLGKIPSTSIVVSISDGIGNQLFKYAFGLSIAKNRSSKLSIDTMNFQGDLEYKRNFKFDKLGIQTDRISIPNRLSIREYFAFIYYLKLINTYCLFKTQVKVKKEE